MKNRILLLIIVPLLLFSQRIEEVRGVKITNVDSQVLSSNSSIAEAMDYLASININTILVVVWNGSGFNGAYTLYPSAVMDSLFGFEKGPTGSVEDPLQRVIIEAHRNGIEVLPWFEYGFATSWSDPEGNREDVPDHILEKYSDWALREQDGQVAWKNGFYWMSAINPEVQDFIKDLTMEVCKNYDIDGIEYSDRIPALPVEGGYDSVTVSIYQQEHDDQSPPDNYQDADWMRWRADKMSDWYQEVRETIKGYDSNLHVSSSPSVYPWSYHEYLQDSKTWVNSGICDDIIPQLYRYDYSTYRQTLNSSLTNFPGKKDIYIAGILMNVGDYIISPDYLLDAMQLNRDKGLSGEVFFFYEGLRKNNNQLGDTLKKAYYRRPALLPHRNSNVWRPKATIVNEDDESTRVTGSWEKLENKNYGYQPDILINKDSEYSSVQYTMDVPFAAWFNLYAYIVKSPKATKNAPYTVYSQDDSSIVTLDQTAYNQTGWQFLKTVYLEQGKQKVVKLDNANVEAGDWVIADAVMAMINRKKSPDVFISPDQVNNIPPEKNQPDKFILYQNYPNPFNAFTTIEYQLPERTFVNISIYDLQGKLVKTVIQKVKAAGYYKERISLANLSSGIYFYRLKTEGRYYSSRKMALLK
jgi:uncharacterized lipoprotein YddW (UPF0748 family)